MLLGFVDAQVLLCIFYNDNFFGIFLVYIFGSLRLARKLIKTFSTVIQDLISQKGVSGTPSFKQFNYNFYRAFDLVGPPA